MKRTVATLLLTSIGLAGQTSAAVPPSALALRDTGLAQLENETPAEAQETFGRLAREVAGDPLPWANLAVAALRQQRHVEALGAADRALSLAPARADLLAIRAAVLEWSGRTEAALPVYRQAAAAAPGDVELHYALYRLASSLEGDAATAATDFALERLVRLRPENPVVLLHALQRAIARGDRTAATGALQRIGELLWQVPEATRRALDTARDPLTRGDLPAARVPALRLENVLKGTTMYQQGLGELRTGLAGMPVARFVDEPAPRAFGTPLVVTWQRHALGSTAATAVVLVDVDGDDRQDLVTVEGGRLIVRRAANAWAPRAAGDAPRADRLTAADLDNDGAWDVLATGSNGVAAWRGDGSGGLAPAGPAFGLAGARGVVAAALDYDSEGDLDLAVARARVTVRPGEAGTVELYRNSLTGPLQAVGNEALPPLRHAEPRDLAAADLDRDGDLDLLLAHAGGITLLDNRRQGTFAARDGIGGAVPGVRRVVAADLDGDGRFDLAAGGAELVLLRNTTAAPTAAAPAPATAFTAWKKLAIGGGVATLTAFDLDNDGRLDLAAGGPGGLHVALQRADGSFAVQRVTAAPEALTGLSAADLDGDGDLDLAVVGRGGTAWLENRGGNRNHWLAVRLRGLAEGNGKNNHFGLGATVEVRDGAARQVREAQGGVTHLGLGSRTSAPLLRVVWTNGVPQNRLQVRGDQNVVEEQVLKGSCPFLYTWDGERFAFVTDLLWGAPLGLPLAPGVWLGADPSELVAVPQAQPRDGRYELRVTEELWEAAFFDHVRLWVVDHPAEVEVASNLRIVPGEQLPERVLASRGLRPLAAAVDGTGADATLAVRHRDEVYAAGWTPSPYQGVAAAPWAFTLDLGEAPGGPVRLHLDGWIFPADASLNLAVAQRTDVAGIPPRLEVEIAGIDEPRWEVLMPSMGFPAGKTKTMVVDTPPLPPGSRRLRIVTGQWLGWDRIAWTTAPADDAPKVVAQLQPESAELRSRGFSRLLRQAPNGPHGYDYYVVSTESPWLPLPGRYTRYGEVGELLREPDDRTVILAAGDELALSFDATTLPPPVPGWRRSVFLESHGWDKDADRNTWEAATLEPLPFRSMSGYPPAAGETFPDTAEHRAYVREWLTREVAPESPGPEPTATAADR
jgi:hypothetical protein